MLGAIIGDIAGSAYEFNRTNDYDFEMFNRDCGFTDDTICTVAVADAILEHKDYGESLHEWCRRYPNPKGSYGGRFHQWVMSDNPKPYNSLGAIVGSIAEAIWGVPTNMAVKAMSYLPSEMKSVVLKFYRKFCWEICPIKGYGDEDAARSVQNLPNGNVQNAGSSTRRLDYIWSKGNE